MQLRLLVQKWQSKLRIIWNLWMFSFAPNKIMTTGQGGLIITNDKKYIRK